MATALARVADLVANQIADGLDFISQELEQNPDAVDDIARGFEAIARAIDGTIRGVTFLNDLVNRSGIPTLLNPIVDVIQQLLQLTDRLGLNLGSAADDAQGGFSNLATDLKELGSEADAAGDQVRTAFNTESALDGVVKDYEDANTAIIQFEADRLLSRLVGK